METAPNGTTKQAFLELGREFRNLMLGERACRWAMGELVARAVALVPEDPDAQREVYGLFAELGHCTIAHVRQTWAVYAAFTAPQRQFLAPMTWSWARACVLAAQRTKRPVWDVVEEAETRNWHLADLNRLGMSRPRRYRLRAKCLGCGARCAVSAGITVGAIPCPVCVARAWADGQDGKEALRLGVLA